MECLQRQPPKSVYPYCLLYIAAENTETRVNHLIIHPLTKYTVVTEVEDIIRGLGKKRYLRLKHKDWCEIMDEYYSRNPEDETKVSTDEAKKKTGDEKTVTDEEKAAAKKKKAQNFMLHVRKSRLKCRDILALCEIFPGKEV